MVTFILRIFLLAADLVALMTLFAAPATIWLPMSSPPEMLVFVPLTPAASASLMVSALAFPGTYMPSMASSEYTSFSKGSMFPARFTEVILTSTRSPSIPVTSPNTGVPLRMRCPSSVRQFSASCIFSVAPTMTVCVECTNARMTFLSSCRTRRTLLNPLRGVSSGTVSSGSVFPGFSSSPSVVSFSLKAEGAGCSVPESGPLPRVCSLRLISSRMRCISLSGETVSSGSSIP